MGFVERMRRPADETMVSRAMDAHPAAVTALAFAFAVLASATCGSFWDNDINYIIALGRSIMQSGIPTTDPLTCNEGLGCIAQQWAFCVGAAWLYDAFGKAGVCAAVAVLWALAAWAVLAAAKAFSGGDSRRAATATALVLLCAFPFMKTNPRALDVACLAVTALAMEKFLAGGGRRWLVIPVAASAAMANLHCSMWVLAAAPVACSLVDGRARGRRPAVLGALALTCAASAASPYGAGSTLFIFKSLAAPGMGTFAINELQPLTFNAADAFFAAPFAAAAIAYISLAARGAGRTDEGKFRPRLADLLFAGFALLALSQIRNCLLFAPVAAWGLLSRMPARQGRRQTCVGAQLARTGICLMALLCLPLVTWARCSLEVPSTSELLQAQQDEVVATLEENGIAPGEAIGNMFNSGGFLELAGYAPLVDERAELLCPEVNGGTDLVGQQQQLGDGLPSAVAGVVADERWRALVVESSHKEHFDAAARENGYELALDSELYAVFVKHREE